MVPSENYLEKIEKEESEKLEKKSKEITTKEIDNINALNEKLDQLQNKE